MFFVEVWGKYFCHFQTAKSTNTLVIAAIGRNHTTIWVYTGWDYEAGPSLQLLNRLR